MHTPGMQAGTLSSAAARRRVQAVEKDRRAVLATIDAKRNAHIRDAKAAFGIWSEMGLAETRRTFWDTYEGGKARCRRARAGTGGAGAGACGPLCSRTGTERA